MDVLIEEKKEENIDEQASAQASAQNEVDRYNYLYPHLDDANFNVKIATKKEFNDTKYDGKIVDDIQKHADILCNSDFEISAHQAFVRNFLSFQTPYNSLLLYHGLGSGKTCSAISVAEEMRQYLKNMDISQHIIIIASPNVQENFRLQLFDDSKLKLIDGIWNIRACTGNSLLKEINPMNMKGLSKERVKSLINRIINTSYKFLGYIQFANYISKITSDYNDPKKRKLIKMRLRNEFNNSLIIIDEVHNIRNSDEKNKLVASAITKVVENTNNLRLLLLSATPMFNNYKEIIWLINIMNKNDKRETIQVKDVFNIDGSFKVDRNGKEIGKELLIRKATGYISFVRGENPYTFPYRIWASEFAKEHTFLYDGNERDVEENGNGRIRPPSIQFNNEVIPPYDRLKMLSVYLVNVGEYQQKAYNYIVKTYLRQQKEKKDKKQQLKSEVDANEVDIASAANEVDANEVDIASAAQEDEEAAVNEVDIASAVQDEAVQDEAEQDEAEQEQDEAEQEQDEAVQDEANDEDIDLIKYTDLQRPIESLNIVYPNEMFDENSQDDEYIFDTKLLVGNEGLSHIMDFNRKTKEGYKYKKDQPHIFKPNLIGKYSGKIKTICDKIMSSTGLVLVYSQFIDGGIVPLSLALEELGFIRTGSRESLLAVPPKASAAKRLKYITITGDKALSPDNASDIKLLTNINNKDGEEIKVVLISQAGTEGIDFKYIRQVHILDAWYNMNRMEQIFGRAVRNCSHKDLPYEKRNVEIYMYGSILSNEIEKEAADLYIYRLAERKSIQIGNVSRVLKETAVDCILNSEQIGFTIENMKKTVRQELSSGVVLDNYQVGDRPYTSACDYMSICEYTCKPDIPSDNVEISLDTYNKVFIMSNSDKIIQRIRDLFKERFFYTKTDLIAFITAVKPYKLVQINAALNKLIEDKYEVVKDKYNREGHIVNIGDLYLFQPIELMNEKISIYERSAPIPYKREALNIKLPNNISLSEYKPPEQKKLQLQKKAKTEKKREKEANAEEHKEPQANAEVQAQANAEVQAQANAAEPQADQESKEKNREKKDDIIKSMMKNYKMATSIPDENAKEKKDKSKDTNWYYNSRHIVNYLKHPDVLKIIGIDDNVILEYIVSHIIYDLDINDMIVLLNYIYVDMKKDEETPFLSIVKRVIDKNIFDKRGMLYIKNKVQQFKNKKMDPDATIMQQLNDIGIVLIVFNDGVWEITDKLSEYSSMKRNIASLRITDKDIKTQKINDTIGFNMHFKNENYIVFKTKNFFEKRSKGSRCDQKPSENTIEIFEKMYKQHSSELYDFLVEERKQQKAVLENKKLLCILQEFIFYIFNEKKVNGKIWYIDPVQSTLSNIENLGA